MSDELFTELRETFLLFDVDGTGKITTRELGPFLKCLGQSYTNSEVE